MQMVTFFSSARPTTFFSASAQLRIPSWSSIPLRLPEKQMTLGNPASAVASTALRILSRHISWFSVWASPGSIGWLLVIVQIRLCFLIVGQSAGVSRSIPPRPILADSAQSFSNCTLPS
jgi:hypothetical protein